MTWATKYQYLGLAKIRSLLACYLPYFLTCLFYGEDRPSGNRNPYFGQNGSEKHTQRFTTHPVRQLPALLGVVESEVAGRVGEGWGAGSFQCLALQAKQVFGLDVSSELDHFLARVNFRAESTLVRAGIHGKMMFHLREKVQNFFLHPLRWDGQLPVGVGPLPFVEH